MSAATISLGAITGTSVPAKRERWLQVVSHLDPKYGGLSAAVPALGRRMAQDGLEISLAAFCAPGEHSQPDGFDSDHLSFWPVARKPWLEDYFKHKVLRPHFEEQVRHADGVHIHGLWEQSTLVAASTAHRLRIPYIVSAHGMLEPWALNHKRLKKWMYASLFERANLRHAACVHALSRAEAQQYLDFGACSPIAIIPNGVDVPATCDAEEFLGLFPKLRGKRIVLFLGRLHPKKGLDLLVEAWCSLAPGFPEAHLVLAGPDSEGTQARLARYIAEQGFDDSISFAGMLRDSMKWSALSAAEAFVLPSFSEGLSVSVLEAMGMALPVIVTTGCNMPEVEEHRAGWQIEVNAKQLAAALEDLFRNTPGANREVGARGAALVAERYTWERVASSMAAVYRWVTGGPEPAHVELVFPECR